jgi:hypothetical protein
MDFVLSLCTNLIDSDKIEWLIELDMIDGSIERPIIPSALVISLVIWWRHSIGVLNTKIT